MIAGGEKREDPVGRTRTLMRAVLAVGLVVMLLITALAASELRSRRERVYDEARRALGLLNVAVAEYTERSMLSYETVLRDLRDDLDRLDFASPSGRVQAEREVMARLGMISGFTAINVVAADGSVVATSLEERRSDVNYSDRDYFRNQRDHGQIDRIAVEPPIFTRRSKRWAIPVTLRMEDAKGQFRGILYAGVDIEALNGYYRSVLPFATGAVTLYRDDGRLLARHPLVEDAFASDYSKSDLFRIHLPNAASGIYRTLSAIDGAPRLVSYRRVSRYGLLIDVSLDERSLDAEWRREVWPVAGGALLALLFFAIATTLIRRQLRHSVAQTRALRDSEQLYRTLVDHSPAAVFLHRHDRILFANDATVALLNAGNVESLKTLSVLDDIVHPDDRQHLVDRVVRMRAGEDPPPTAVRFRTCDGSYRDVEETSALVNFGKGRALLTLAKDITERKALEARLQWQAHHDALTDLPNRFLFGDRLDRAIEAARRHGRSLALVFVDLDHFKRVNDTLGHLTGDALLCQAAVRLGGMLRASDTVARLGGDEFAILLSETERKDDAERVAAKVVETFAVPFMLDGRSITVTASVGIALFPDDGQGASELMAAADAAMYSAKDGGRNSAHVFDPRIGERIRQRLTLENALRGALDANQLSLAFQPLFTPDGRFADTAEALLRWRHPELGQVAPDTFIPIAEETGLVVGIGDWVLRRACEQLVVWRKTTGRDLRVAINVSARQFEEAQFAERVIAVLRDCGLTPADIELEITERLLIEPKSVAAANIARLHEYGVALSLDDFGTGYSSLSCLGQTPVSTLKIDRSFVARLGQNEAEAALVAAIVALANSLGLQTVAEGVETDAQQAHLASLSVNLTQGYLTSRPLAESDFLDWLGRC